MFSNAIVVDWDLEVWCVPVITCHVGNVNCNGKKTCSGSIMLKLWKSKADEHETPIMCTLIENL
jgi:hypothetical protein